MPSHLAPQPPPQTQRCVEGSQKLPIITLCLSTVCPICAVIISVFEALMAALPGKIMGPIIFNELHQRFQWACYHSNKDTLGSNTTFLSSKWLSLCEAKEHPFYFSFSALLDLKGPRKTVYKEAGLTPCRVPFALARWTYMFYWISKFSKVKPALPWSPISTQKYDPMKNIFQYN